MNTTTEQKKIVPQAEIAKAAWRLWEKEGCQHGRDQEHWLKAERELLATGQQGKAETINAGAKRKTQPTKAKTFFRL